MKTKVKKRAKSENEKFVESTKRGDLTQGIPPKVEITYLRLSSGEFYFIEPQEEITVTGIRSFT